MHFPPYYFYIDLNVEKLNNNGGNTLKNVLLIVFKLF